MWSDALTDEVARRVPDRLRPRVLTAIVAAHTAIFATMAVAIVVVAWDGLRQRPGRRTMVAAAAVIGESAVYVSNGQVCPLTPLATELGDRREGVADIFLPSWASRRIPLVGGSALLAGLGLNALAIARRAQERV